MDPQIELFISQWHAEFPGIKTPELKFDGVEDVEKRLSSCKNAIKNLEEKLKQERFQLIFLQVESCGYLVHYGFILPTFQDPKSK